MSCAVLLVFLASLGSWMFNVGRLAHELGDQMASFTGAADSSHGPAHHVTDRSQPAGDSDHALLHSAAHIQPCPFLDLDWPLTAQPDTVRDSFIAPAVAHATREAPFRPPRTSSSLA